MCKTLYNFEGGWGWGALTDWWALVDTNLFILKKGKKEKIITSAPPPKPPQFLWPCYKTNVNI